MDQQAEEESKDAPVGNSSQDNIIQTSIEKNQIKAINSQSEDSQDAKIGNEKLTDSQQRKRDSKKQEKKVMKEMQIQRQMSFPSGEMKIPMAIYSEDGEQGWNFNARATVENCTIVELYDAAIEVVSKQMIDPREKDLSGLQNDFDLIGGNKIILFQKKEGNLRQMQHTGAFNESDQLTVKILNTQSPKKMLQTIELPGDKPEGYNISYAMYLPRKMDDKYYFNIATKLIDNGQGKGLLGKTVHEILQNLNSEESMDAIIEKNETLFKEIEKVEKCLGGPRKAYHIEKKTRWFVDQVLRFVTEQFNTQEMPEIYIDMEVELRLFHEVIKPDYQVMRSAQFLAMNCEGEPDMLQDTPLYAIEVKRTDDRSTDLAKGLEQHFK